MRVGSTSDMKVASLVETVRRDVRIRLTAPFYANTSEKLPDGHAETSVFAARRHSLRPTMHIPRNTQYKPAVSHRSLWMYNGI